MKINRRYLLQGSALVLFVIAGFGFFGPKNSGINLATPAVAQNLSDLMVPGPMGDKIMGDEKAPVTIIEYASMTCPHCAAFHNDVLPGIKEKYIDTGKAKLIFREFPFDPRAFAAFMLARCADDQYYFPMIEVLFKQQVQWARADDPRPPLLQIAKLAGFTQESFETCLKNQQVLDSVNAVKTKAAEQYGVNGTPTFFINGEKFTGNYTLEALSGAIDKLL